MITTRMTTSFLVTVFVSALGASTCLAQPSTSDFSLSTAFTYRGRLEQRGAAADGRFDVSFELFDQPVGGTLLGRVDRLSLGVEAGALVADVDFGRSVFGAEELWLDIAVRPEGGDLFTRLLPRQRAAAGVGGCTVPGDLIVDGNLGVGINSPLLPLEVRGAPDATLAGGGALQLHGFLRDMVLDDDEIMARTLGTPSKLLLNAEGGNVGIGTGAPQAALHVVAASDVGAGGGGIAVIGDTAGINVAIDGNEIMARNGGATSTLYLNAEGSPVVVGGKLDFGWQIVSNSASSISVVVNCPSGKKVLGGGCKADDIIPTPDALAISRPFNNGTAWECFMDDSNGSILRAYAICANVQ